MHGLRARLAATPETQRLGAGLVNGEAVDGGIDEFYEFCPTATQLGDLARELRDALGFNSDESDERLE